MPPDIAEFLKYEAVDGSDPFFAGPLSSTGTHFHKYPDEHGRRSTGRAGLLYDLRLLYGPNLGRKISEHVTLFQQ